MGPSPRATLVAQLDRYISTRTQGGDISSLLAAQARVTENGRELADDRAFWRNIALTSYRLVFADEMSRQVGCHATFQEGEAPGVLGLRIKIADDGKILEAERLVTRKGDANAFAPHRLVAPDPLFDRVEAAVARSSRQRLVDIADAYFDAIEASDGTGAPISDTCKRVENGLLTTNNPKIGLPWSCREGMRIFSYLERARDRRYVLVDEPRGLVWAIAAFDVPDGSVLSLLADGQRVERPQVGRSIFLMELFKVVEGEITAIDVVVRNMPPKASLGWPV